MISPKNITTPNGFTFAVGDTIVINNSRNSATVQGEVETVTMGGTAYFLIKNKRDSKPFCTLGLRSGKISLSGWAENAEFINLTAGERNENEEQYLSSKQQIERLKDKNKEKKNEPKKIDRNNTYNMSYPNATSTTNIDFLNYFQDYIQNANERVNDID